MKYLGIIFRNKAVYFWLLATLLGLTPVHAQLRISYPYSVYGIGDMTYANTVQSASMGNLRQAYRSPFAINHHNPASYSAFTPQSFVFETGVTSHLAELQHATGTQDHSYTSLGSMRFGFPVTKWWKSSLGIAPVSKVGFSVKTTGTSAETGYTYEQQFEQYGGLNNFYVGHAFEPVKGLSLGFNTNYYFGQFVKSQQVSMTNVTANNTLVTTRLNIGGLAATYGLQYTLFFKDTNVVVPVKRKLLLMNARKAADDRYSISISTDGTPENFKLTDTLFENKATCLQSKNKLLLDKLAGKDKDLFLIERSSILSVNPNTGIKRYRKSGRYVMDGDNRYMLIEVKDSSTSAMQRFGLRLRKLTSNLSVTFALTGNGHSDLNGREDILAQTFVKTAFGNSIQDTIQFNQDRTAQIRYPRSVGGGIFINKVGKWMLGFDVQKNYWSEYFNYSSYSGIFPESDAFGNPLYGYGDRYIADSWNTSVGLEITIKDLRYRLGYRYENSYYRIITKHIEDFGISFGVGIPLKKSLSTLNLGVEVGRRGTTKYNMYQEEYAKLFIGIGVYERWFVKSKYK